MKLKFQGRSRSISYLLATDWLVMVGSFCIALYFRRYSPNMDIINLKRWHVVPDVIIVAIFSSIMLGFFAFQGLYKRRVWLSAASHLVKILQCMLVMVLGYLLLKTFIKLPFFTPSRLVILNWTFLTTVALCIHRLFIFPELLRMASQAGLQRRVALIGDSMVARDFLNRLSEKKSWMTIEPVGVITNHDEPLENVNLPKLGTISDLPNIVDLYNLQGAIIADPDLSYEGLIELVEQCVSLFGWVDIHASRSSVWHSPSLNPDTYFDIPFVRISSIPRGVLYTHYKRYLDATLSFAGLVVLLPLVAAVALLIKATSPGPIFYYQQRSGLRGKPFKFYKFRSMRMGADQDPSRKAVIANLMKSDTAAVGKVVNESFITPVGHFIRKWAIDEIPQLLNVIKGDMALVGPRPLPMDEYKIQDSWQKKRFEIRPGCTGLWKIMVSGKGGVTFAQTALYDLFYARNMSPMMDVYILMQTVWIILRGKADEKTPVDTQEK